MFWSEVGEKFVTRHFFLQIILNKIYTYVSKMIVRTTWTAARFIETRVNWPNIFGWCMKINENILQHFYRLSQNFTSYLSQKFVDHLYFVLGSASEIIRLFYTYFSNNCAEITPVSLTSSCFSVGLSVYVSPTKQSEKFWTQFYKFDFREFY
jgi:hypothetical protein